jgi:hypothetical protein
MILVEDGLTPAMFTCDLSILYEQGGYGLESRAIETIGTGIPMSFRLHPTGFI